MSEWVKQRWGERGVTLPFLVGALAIKNKNLTTTAEDAQSLLREMVADPVSGYLIEIGWCPMLRAPVLAARKVGSIGFSHAVGFKHPSNDQLCLVFSQEFQQKGDSSDAESLLKVLIDDAEEPIKNKTYSRDPNSKTYKEFAEGELKFIREIFAITNR